MKLYIAAGRYVGTQAEAKAIEKTFTTVEVPTDKPGLIDYLNRTQIDADRHQQIVEDEFQNDDFETVVERQDPVTYSAAQRSVDLDEAFQAAPLGQQLTLATLALEAARDQLVAKGERLPKAPQGYQGKITSAAGFTPTEEDRIAEVAFGAIDAHARSVDADELFS